MRSMLNPWFSNNCNDSFSMSILPLLVSNICSHSQRDGPVRVRLASEDEKAALWPRLLEICPTWPDYTQRTDRGFRACYLESV